MPDSEALVSSPRSAVTLISLFAWAFVLSTLAASLLPAGAELPPNVLVDFRVFGVLLFRLTPQQQTLLFIMTCGGLGGCLRQFRDQLEVQALSLGACILQTMTGAAMGLLLFTLVRGGLVLVITGGDLNPFGMASLGFVAGFTSADAMEKLRQIGTTLYHLPNSEESQVKPNVQRKEVRDPGSDVVAAISRLEDQLARMQINPVLDNFTGYVTVSVRSTEGRGLSIREHELPSSVGDATTTTRVRGIHVTPGQRCQVLVRFQVNEDKSRAGYQERIEITNGNVAKMVTFAVAFNWRSIKIPIPGASTTFKPNSGSAPLVFELKCPDQDGRYDMFVEISQKNRFLVVLPVSFAVAGSA